MTHLPAVRKLLAGLALLAGSAAQAFAQGTPTPAQMFDPKLAPKQDDVPCAVPTPDELTRCTVEFVKGPVANSGGWLLKDPRGQPVRGFFDTTGRVNAQGRTNVDTWRYYKDGVEVYREFDTAGKGVPNNFRWINAGGTKWGVGGVNANGKGFITAWRMISAEEVGQEAYHAVANRDFARLQLLFITEPEMQALKLSSTSTKRIASTLQTAQQNFGQLTNKVNLAGAKFNLVEGHPASASLEDGDTTVIKYRNRPVQYEKGGKVDWLHTGEMIQVGLAWRLAAVPSDAEPGHGGPTAVDPKQLVTPELQKLFDALTKLDENPPPPSPPGAKNQAVETYYATRIGLVRKIMAVDKADQRDLWFRQLFDNYASRAQNSANPTTLAELNKLKDDVVAQMPNSALAPYGIFRIMGTNYALEMIGAPQDKVGAIQDRYHAQLSAFVTKYAKAEDTAEALWQLAVSSEFAGKDQESKGWYKRLFEDFPNNEHAARARGSVARLNLPGNPIKLSAPLLSNPGQTFDIAQLKGKAVIVHYWASFMNNYTDDFARLKLALDAAAKKSIAVELVSINLDDTPEKAKAALRTVTTPATHLYEAPTNNASGGGLNSRLATQYGIHVLPTLFMVDPDGRVTNRALQISDIEMELRASGKKTP